MNKTDYHYIITALFRHITGSVDGTLIHRGLPVSSTVFTDFHLFDQLLGPDGKPPDSRLVETWLDELQMRGKLVFSGDRVTNPRLSQGQRKRLAMLVAIAEQREQASQDAVARLDRE